jgi:hypothetical protein
MLRRVKSHKAITSSSLLQYIIFKKILIAASFRNALPIQCPGDGAQGAVDIT